MRVSELMEYLGDFNPDSEVRMALQPSWPFEHEIYQVSSIEDKDGIEIVYLAEGNQIDYLPQEIKDNFNW